MNFYRDIRPKHICDFVPDSEEQLNKLEMLVKNQITFPSPSKKSIILHGRYGTGKTELAKLLPSLIEKHRVDNFDEKAFSSPFEHEISIFLSCQANDYASKLRQAMPTQVSFNASQKHYVILDEFDNIPPKYQKSMKSSITEHDHVIYIMTTNHLNKVDAGIKSRSHCISFEKPSKDLWLKRCEKICAMFDATYDERYLKNLIHVSMCDARDILTALEERIVLEKSRAA